MRVALFTTSALTGKVVPKAEGTNGRKDADTTRSLVKCIVAKTEVREVDDAGSVFAVQRKLL